MTLILIIAFILSQFGMIRKIFTKTTLTRKDVVALSLIFGGMGILGTYTGIEINGAIANARVISVFVGGLIGGPKVGLIAGIIAGGHRYLIDVGGFTAFSCSVSTILEGILAGKLHKSYQKSQSKVRFSFIWGAVAEVGQMILIIILSTPQHEAIELVKIIAIPMIIANAFGISAFIAIFESIYKEVENEAAYQSQLALQIADESLKYFRSGYNAKTAQAIAKIIKNYVDIDAVAFTDTEKILAHVGAADDHHLYGVPLQTSVTKDVVINRKSKICQNSSDINCLNKDCLLKSAVIVPLTVQNVVIGSLKLYKVTENAITKSEKQLAVGLAKLFSTQIELSEIDIQRELLTQSELKALQAQINPHFLFNAINTISSLIRIDPEEARKVLLHLGKYFRSNICNTSDDVSIHKELEHVDSYIQIEKARFKEKLHIVYDVNPNTQCSIPPLIIQPLVENAIKHGVCDELDGGTVHIRVVDNCDNVVVYVSDDGVGIDSNRLSKLLSCESCTDKIGLRNVHERLINKYGQAYGLNIESKPGSGTEVNFVIPKEGVI